MKNKITVIKSFDLVKQWTNKLRINRLNFLILLQNPFL